MTSNDPPPGSAAASAWPTRSIPAMPRASPPPWAGRRRPAATRCRRCGNGPSSSAPWARMDWGRMAIPRAAVSCRRRMTATECGPAAGSIRPAAQGRRAGRARVHGGRRQGKDRPHRCEGSSPCATNTARTERPRSWRNRTSSPPAQWRDPVEPTSVLLFRYSAVTFNGHRIHYDHPYVTTAGGSGLARLWAERDGTLAHQGRTEVRGSARPPPPAGRHHRRQPGARHRRAVLHPPAGRHGRARDQDRAPGAVISLVAMTSACVACPRTSSGPTAPRKA